MPDNLAFIDYCFCSLCKCVYFVLEAGFEVWSTVGFYTWTLLFGTWQVGMQLEINMNDVYVE